MTGVRRPGAEDATLGRRAPAIAVSPAAGAHGANEMEEVH